MMPDAFLDYDSVSRGDLDAGPLLDVLPELALHAFSDARQIRERTAEAQVVCVNKAIISREVIAGAKRLELIALAATGSNNIDLAAARERGIAVCNIRSYCTDSVAQHAWGAILTLTHHLRDYARLAQDGSWARHRQFTMLDHPIRELRGLHLGIVGWGELGGAVARLGEAFGMRILIAQRRGGEPKPGRVALPELLRAADILSLHCPLTDATRGLIGREELALMKPDALLINTARGGLVDSAALAEALRAGRIGGAAIDVLVQEPPVNADPLLDPGIPNLLLTPHIAWAAREARQRCLTEMAANIRDYFAGGQRGRLTL
jgi:glycerate dehydrogenase